MERKELAILDGNSYLKDNINKYLEGFVKFYGKEEKNT